MAVLDVFNQVPTEPRKHFLKGFKTINELIEQQNQGGKVDTKGGGNND